MKVIKNCKKLIRMLYLKKTIRNFSWKLMKLLKKVSPLEMIGIISILEEQNLRKSWR